jgi:hypothetical protein
MILATAPVLRSQMRRACQCHAAGPTPAAQHMTAAVMGAVVGLGLLSPGSGLAVENVAPVQQQVILTDGDSAL